MDALEERARALYEAACAELLYVTTAAWVRWDDLCVDGRLSWLARAREVTR